MPWAGNDAICDADHAPQFANGLFRSFSVQGGDDFARKCYMTAHSRDMDSVEIKSSSEECSVRDFRARCLKGLRLRLLASQVLRLRYYRWIDDDLR